MTSHSYPFTGEEQRRKQAGTDRIVLGNEKPSLSVIVAAAERFECVLNEPLRSHTHAHALGSLPTFPSVAH